MRELLHNLMRTSGVARGSLAVLGVVGIALMVTAAVVKLPSDEAKRPGVERSVAALALAGAAFVVAGALAFVQAAGRILPADARARLLPAPNDVGVVLFGDLGGRAILGVVVAVAVPCAAAIATRAASTRERVAAIVATAPLFLAGVTVAWDAFAESARVLHVLAPGDDIMTAARRFVADLGLLGGAASAVPWVAVAVFVVAIVVTHRERVSRAQLVLGAAVLALGATAFASTGAIAWDARHPIPYDEQRLLRPDEGGPDYGPLPVREPGVPCGDLEFAPMLLLTHTTPTLDGRTVDARRLEEDLATMRRNWSILHPREVFPGVLTLARGVGERALPYDDVVAIARRTGYVELQRLAVVETRVRTATRGEVVLHRFCAQRVELP